MVRVVFFNDELFVRNESSWLVHTAGLIGDDYEYPVRDSCDTELLL